MTIQSAASRNSYTSSGGTTYPYTFKILDAADLVVYDEGAVVSSAAYTVTNVGVVGGGNVVFTIAPTAGHTIILLSQAAYTQGLDLVENDPLPADGLEQALDRNTILVKQLHEQIGRAPRFDAFGCDRDVMVDHPQGGYFLMWNAAGTRVVNGQQVLVGTLVVPTFTPGSVLFATDVTTIGQDNGQLFWDTAATRLAVGTGTPDAAKLTVTPGSTESGIILIATGGTAPVALEVVSASSAAPAATVLSTAATALNAFNVTDAGSEVANRMMTGALVQSVYGHAAIVQQGLITGCGSTLVRNSVNAALCVTRVVVDLNGFNYTAPLLRVLDTTTSTGPLIDAVRGGVEQMSLSAAGSLQSCELRVLAATTTPVVRAVYDQSLAKAWVVFDGTNVSPITPAISYNIKDARVTKLGTGDYCVSFTTVFACSRYLLQGSAIDDGAAQAYAVTPNTLNAGCCRFRVRTTSGDVLADRTVVSVSFYGRQ